MDSSFGWGIGKNEIPNSYLLKYFCFILDRTNRARVKTKL